MRSYIVPAFLAVVFFLSPNVGRAYSYDDLDCCQNWFEVKSGKHLDINVCSLDFLICANSHQCIQDGMVVNYYETANSPRPGEPGWEDPGCTRYADEIDSPEDSAVATSND